MISDEVKDWQVAKMMFEKNGKPECKLVKGLRKHGVVEPLCDEYSIITDSRLEDDCGWLIPNEALK